MEEDNLCKRGRGVKVAKQINYIREGVIPTYLQDGTYLYCWIERKLSVLFLPKIDVRFVQKYLAKIYNVKIKGNLAQVRIC
jgi:hypothetical protein